jgi:hypothetical protein
MDHEIIPRLCKICDWLLNSSWDHFGSHQGENARVTVEFKVPKRHIVDLHYPLNGPTSFAVGEAKEVLWYKRARARAWAWQRNTIKMIFLTIFLGKRR